MNIKQVGCDGCGGNGPYHAIHWFCPVYIDADSSFFGHAVKFQPTSSFFCEECTKKIGNFIVELQKENSGSSN